MTCFNFLALFLTIWDWNASARSYWMLKVCFSPPLGLTYHSWFDHLTFNSCNRQRTVLSFSGLSGLDPIIGVDIFQSASIFVVKTFLSGCRKIEPTYHTLYRKVVFKLFHYTARTSKIDVLNTSRITSWYSWERSAWLLLRIFTRALYAV